MSRFFQIFQIFWSMSGPTGLVLDAPRDGYAQVSWQRPEAQVPA